MNLAVSRASQHPAGHAAPPASPSPPRNRQPRHLVLSAHDYRTPRRANIHFITAELAKRGPTRFFSLRYSRLSRLKGDARLFLDTQANTVVRHQDVDCYLWRTPLHPFNSRRRWARPIEDAMFEWYASHPPSILREWIADSDVIVFESGTAIAFIALARRINPRARLVYRGSDALSAIDVAAWIDRTFERVMPELDVVAMVSPAMTEGMAGHRNVFHVGHGIDPGLADLGDPSPYAAGVHAVSVGSMLFDPGFFAVAGRAFPEVTFHVIGSGRGRQPEYGDNIVVYDEMPHAGTIRYIKHARIGIAPYASAQVPAYLADSSMKLLQYEFLGVPAVCPHAVVGGRPSRHGYAPGDGDSLVAAVAGALAAPRGPARTWPDWAETTDRILDPSRYPDTRITTGEHA